jgi:hypothetical protein
MTVYAAFLRGINVGGHKPIRMAPLRDLCAALALVLAGTARNRNALAGIRDAAGAREA